jgi:hypothetical protein
MRIFSPSSNPRLSLALRQRFSLVGGASCAMHSIDAITQKVVVIHFISMGI